MNNSLTGSTKTPAAEVSKSNPWYVDDQFAVQLGNPGSRHVIENRWRVFEAFIGRWRATTAERVPLRVLDAGCGDGINLFGLGRLLDCQGETYELFGCDYNDLRIGRAIRLKGVKAVTVCSLTAMPVVSAAFDVVLCNHVLEHISADAAAMAELHRILRPGGLLIAGVPNEGCAMAQLRNRLFQPEIGRTTDHVNFYTAESFVPRLQAAGFVIEAVERHGLFTPRLSWNARLQSGPLGRRLLRALSRLMPSQAADLLVAARRPAAAERP